MPTNNTNLPVSRASYSPSRSIPMSVVAFLYLALAIVMQGIVKAKIYILTNKDGFISRRPPGGARLIIFSGLNHQEGSRKYRIFAHEYIVDNILMEKNFLSAPYADKRVVYICEDLPLLQS